MSEEKQERKPKWDQPEIEDFSDEDAEQARQKLCNPNFGGCRPVMDGGCRPMGVNVGMCRPNAVCSPSGPGFCRPGRLCFPHFYFMHPYCRPNGFNHGFGCFPRR